MKLLRRPPPSIIREPVGSWPIEAIHHIPAVRAAASHLCIRQPPLQAPADAPVLAQARQRLSVILTELAANALTHAGPPVLVSLQRSPDSWLLSVSDGSPHVVPRPRASTPSQRGGRGLTLAMALAPAMGWYADAATKTVWADIPDQPPPALLRSLGTPSSPSGPTGDQTTETAAESPFDERPVSE